MNAGYAPPTLNLYEPGLALAVGFGISHEEMKRFHLVPLVAEPMNVEAVAVNSFGLGGQSVVLIFVRPSQ